ncbi:MAG: ParB/RepB/Spo0J family partition protein [Fimbriimonadaceae bacterium]|nr:ParB/RepB/Spo0J family partition protein [Fimbriimonadaceae bacterium]
MRRALGKGLSQLIGEQVEQMEPGSQEVSIDSIVPNERQPRQFFDETALQELADSIKEHGILQPILVRPIAEGKYELIAGERRWRAAKLAGLTTVPVIVRSAANVDALEWSLIENIQRADITPLEMARAYRRLIDEFGLTQEQVAEKVGKSRVAVTNTVRLLKLQPKILKGLEEGKITEGHARALLGLESPVMQLAIYDKILEQGLTVRDVEKTSQATSTKTARATKGGRPRVEATKDADTQMLEEALSTYFGSPVKIERGEVGGKLQVEFYSEDDLTRILDVLGIRL